MALLPSFSLDSGLDATALASRYATTGRVQIRNFLASGLAESLHADLRRREDWVQVINSGEKLFELPRAARASMSSAMREDLDQAVYAGARGGFQFRYEAIRVSDEAVVRAASTDPLARLAQFLSSDEVCAFLRQVTGEPRIDFADAQGTAFAPGDFLTGHDDAVAGKHRHAAYVLGLTPTWRTEWGGLLLFHDPHGVVGLTPSFNTLNLFRVPQPHSVSEVTRAAAFRRYSVTGWLRSR